MPSRTSATRHTSLGESLRFFPGPLLSLNRGGGFPYSGLQERSHGGLNLLIMRTKPHQMTLSLREKELSLRDMALHIRSVRRINQAIIFAGDDENRSSHPAQISTVVMDIMEKS